MSYQIDLAGRVALVTGASSGLGAQFARVLARSGAAVVLSARRVERLKTLRAEIEAEGGDAHVVPMDVNDPVSIRAGVAHAETEMGSIDILVNNSGVSTTQKLTDVTPEDYDYVMNTNTRGAFFVAQEVAKRMIARAQGSAPGTYTGGRIVNIASMAGLRAMSKIGVYAMSKAAVVHMTRAMALEWGRYDINVNALCPGYIDTEINHHHWQTESGQKLIQMLPRKRPAAGPGCRTADVVCQRGPLHQRRHHPGRRRVRGMTTPRRLRRRPPRGARPAWGGPALAA
jgi:NAD(P)-dependent dehydrogenase (short-subunit alcohol dehydrogenase family)